MRYPPIPHTSPLPHNIGPPAPLGGSLPPTLTLPLPPSKNSKSIFAFWHSGIHTLPPYLLRNVVNWYRRYSPLGWTVYVLDNVPGSPLNVSNYIDTTSPSVIPDAFVNGDLNGNFVAQHTSDLIRYPLLLKYGGVYLDVGILQFGDLDALWTSQIANPSSPFDLAGFTMGSPPELQIVNFALMAAANNPLILRAHRILLKMWEGRTNTIGLHKHPLVNHVPLLKVPREVVVEEEGQEKMVINDAYMTDYAIQIQCMGAAQGWLDEEDGWDGPKYVREKCWLFNMIDQAYVGEQVCGWSGQRFYDLLSLPLPKGGEVETEDQKLARMIVEKSIAESWCLKLMHGFSSKLFGGDTLGMLWRKHARSDCKDDTYAGWLRWAELHCQQDLPTKRMHVPVLEPTMIGNLPK